MRTPKKNEEPAESEAKVRAYALVRDTEGWRLIVCALPHGTVIDNAIEVCEPDPLDLVIDRIESRIKAAL